MVEFYTNIACHWYEACMLVHHIANRQGLNKGKWSYQEFKSMFHPKAIILSCTMGYMESTNVFLLKEQKKKAFNGVYVFLFILLICEEELLYQFWYCECTYKLQSSFYFYFSFFGLDKSFYLFDCLKFRSWT